jgi:hypothetical protein
MHRMDEYNEVCTGAMGAHLGEAEQIKGGRVFFS